MSWRKARLLVGWSERTALAVGAIRLFFWHLAQPALYFFVLYLYCDVISPLQLGFGICVAVREGLYVLAVVVETIYDPSFLLVNLSAGCKRERDATGTERRNQASPPSDHIPNPINSAAIETKDGVFNVETPKPTIKAV